MEAFRAEVFALGLERCGPPTCTRGPKDVIIRYLVFGY